MLFWIIVGLVAAVTIGAVVWSVCEGWNDGLDHVVFGFIGLFVSGGVGFLLMVVTTAVIHPPLERVVVSEKTQQLRALGNASGLEGRSYFLGGGYVKDKRVLNFITNNEGGAIKVERADAEDSVIYEDSTVASVKVTHVDYVNGWIVPFPLGDDHEYESHIPAGSVVESYALDNK